MQHGYLGANSLELWGTQVAVRWYLCLPGKYLIQSSDTHWERAQTTTYPSRFQTLNQNMFPGNHGRGSWLDSEHNRSGEEVRQATLEVFPANAAGAANSRFETDSRHEGRRQTQSPYSGYNCLIHYGVSVMGSLRGCVGVLARNVMWSWTAENLHSQISGSCFMVLRRFSESI